MVRTANAADKPRAPGTIPPARTAARESECAQPASASGGGSATEVSILRLNMVRCE